MILAIFDLQAAPIFNQVSSQLVFRFMRRSVKQIFKMAAKAASWISDQNICSYFNLQFISLLPAKFRVIGLSVQQKERKTYLQIPGHGGHLGFLIETLLGTIQLHAVPIFRTRFQVNWSFGSGQEAQNRF